MDRATVSRRVERSGGILVIGERQLNRGQIRRKEKNDVKGAVRHAHLVRRMDRIDERNLRRRLESCHLLDGAPASKTRKSSTVHTGVHRPPSYTNLSSRPGRSSNCQSSYMSWLHARPQALKTMVEASRRSASVPSSK